MSQNKSRVGFFEQKGLHCARYRESKASIQDANFQNADLTGANFGKVKFAGTDFTGAICPNGYQFGVPGANCPTRSRANLKNTNIGCSAKALFAIAAPHALSYMNPAYLGWNGAPPLATCQGGWAVLTGFKVDTDTGWGLALFQQIGGQWKFVMMQAPGYHFCDQYPKAALVVLGSRLCGE